MTEIMKTIFSVFLLFLSSLTFAQLNLSAIQVDSQWPDTTIVDSSHIFNVVIMNDTTVTYNDSLWLHFSVDSGSTGSFDTPDSVKLGSAFGTVTIAGLDTASFPVMHTFSSLRYAPGNNVVVIWPANGGEHGDSLFLDVYVLYPSSLAEIDISNHLSVYPNPFDSEITINNLLSSGQLTYRLFDVSGKLVELGSILQPTMNLTHLNQGVYQLQVFGPDFQHTIRILKR